MDRKTAYNLQAEMAVLGSIINDSNKIIDIKEFLYPEFFYDQRHQVIYECFLRLFEQKKVIDLVTVDDNLKSNGKLEQAGSIDYIVELSDSISVAINAVEYAKIVHEKFLIRETTSRAQKIIFKGENCDDSAELIEFAEGEIFNLAKMTRSQEFLDWGDLIVESQNRLEELLNRDNKNALTGLATGFENLNYYTNGLQNGDLIILAARPSVGKTAFALNLAKNVAGNETNRRNGELPHVAVFSLEMSADQLMTRLVSTQTGVPISNIRSGKIDDSEKEQIGVGFDFLNGLNIHIDETPGIKLGDLKSKCRKLKLEEGLDMIVIDYLQLITTANPSTFRQQDVSEISRELKALAKELKVPIIAISQLSRAVESRPDKKPMMSDIRESGAIEQDADIIMMLYRPEYYGSNIEQEDGVETYPGQTILIINKNRNGSTGEIEFQFIKEINKFVKKDNGFE